MQIKSRRVKSYRSWRVDDIAGQVMDCIAAKAGKGA